jgi:hypothetical protein
MRWQRSRRSRRSPRLRQRIEIDGLAPQHVYPEVRSPTGSRPERKWPGRQQERLGSSAASLRRVLGAAAQGYRRGRARAVSVDPRTAVAPGSAPSPPPPPHAAIIEATSPTPIPRNACCASIASSAPSRRIHARPRTARQSRVDALPRAGCPVLARAAAGQTGCVRFSCPRPRGEYRGDRCTAGVGHDNQKGGAAAAPRWPRPVRIVLQFRARNVRPATTTLASRSGTVQKGILSRHAATDVGGVAAFRARRRGARRNGDRQPRPESDPVARAAPRPKAPATMRLAACALANLATVSSTRSAPSHPARGCPSNPIGRPRLRCYASASRAMAALASRFRSGPTSL